MSTRASISVPGQATFIRRTGSAGGASVLARLAAAVWGYVLIAAISAVFAWAFIGARTIMEHREPKQGSAAASDESMANDARGGPAGSGPARSAN